MTDADLLLSLSRLLDDDLPADEAAALRARIAEEPEVARAWAELRALSAGLDALPDAITPPPALDAAVAEALTASPAAPSEPSPPRPRLALWGALAAAAGLLLVMAGPWSSPLPARLTLAGGAQLVEGDSVAVATLSGAEVTVSGKALISVEPHDAGLREGGQMPPTEDELMTKYLLSAAAGAVLTVAVYEGTAEVTPPDGGDAVTVSAGEQQVFASAGEEGMSRPQRRVVVRRPGGGSEDGAPQTVAELEAEVEALRRHVAALELERDLQEGALKAMEGEPQPWPEDGVAEAFAEPGFTSRLEELVSGNPDLELLGVDCEEFPCMAVLRDHSSEEGWMRGLHQDVSGQWPDEDELKLSMWVSQLNEDGRPAVGLAGVSIVPPGVEGEELDAVRTRSEWRMGAWLEEVTDDAKAQREGAQP